MSAVLECPPTVMRTLSWRAGSGTGVRWSARMRRRSLRAGALMRGVASVTRGPVTRPG